MTTIKELKPEVEQPPAPRFRLPEVIDWSIVAIYTLRVLAVFSLFRAIVLWMIILDITNVRGVSFVDATPGFQAAIVFFAVFDMVTGIGLWLTAAWGGALWLISVLVKLVIDIVSLMDAGTTITMISRGPVAGAMDLVLVAIYVVITAKATLQHRSG